jgi:hypothetical protein
MHKKILKHHENMLELKVPSIEKPTMMTCKSMTKRMLVTYTRIAQTKKRNGKICWNLGVEDVK